MEEFRRVLITVSPADLLHPLTLQQIRDCYLPADILARYLWAKRIPVKFILGIDEEAPAAAAQAHKEGVSVRELSDRAYNQIREDIENLDFAFDVFSQSSGKHTEETALELFKELNSGGKLLEKEAPQFCTTKGNAFIPDELIQGKCPHCGSSVHPGWCLHCQQFISPTELINPKNTNDGQAVRWQNTRQWFIPLQDILDYYHEKWEFQERKTDGNLSALFKILNQNKEITLPVTYKNNAGKDVLRPWFTLLAYYITATQRILPQHWEGYWKMADTGWFMFIPPSELAVTGLGTAAVMQASSEFIIPERIFTASPIENEFKEEDLFKRSLKDFVNEYNSPLESLRYVLARTLKTERHSVLTPEDYRKFNDEEFLATLQTFTHEALNLMHYFSRGKVPFFNRDVIDEDDQALEQKIKGTVEKVTVAIENFEFSQALGEILNLAQAGQSYLEKKDVRRLAKDTENKRLTVKLTANAIYIGLQTVANLTILLHPFLPNTALKMCHMLKVVERMLEWKNAGNMNLLRSGYSLRFPEEMTRPFERLAADPKAKE